MQSKSWTLGYLQSDVVPRGTYPDGSATLVGHHGGYKAIVPVGDDACSHGIAQAHA